MNDYPDDEPELVGYEPYEDKPLRSRRRRLIMRIVVMVGIACLVLPSILVAFTVGSATAKASCTVLVAYAVPSAAGSSARFELFGPGFIGWECYSIGAFGGDHHVASLGLIPGGPRIPVKAGNS
jgi:hypothetical protein